MSLSCDMSPLSLTATGGRSGCVSVVCRCHVTCLLSLSYSYWWPEWLCECRVSLSCDMSPLSLTACVRSGCVALAESTQDKVWRQDSLVDDCVQTYHVIQQPPYPK